jgi:hypothetical protein
MKSSIACRICANSRLTTIFSLGNMAISNFIARPRRVPSYPLTLLFCDPKKNGCGLVQLAPTSITQDTMYRQYWYASGINQSMREALADIVQSIKKRIPLKKGDVVMDIGANDGTMLGFYPKSLTRIAFEPATNLIQRTKRHATRVINDYFSHKAFTEVSKDKKAKIITTIAMFYDLEDPNRFVSDLSNSLTQNGVWVNQMASLSDTIHYNMFDNICHEHIEHYSLSALEHLLARHNMRVVDIETNNVNGGSMRVYIMHELAARTSNFAGAKKRIAAYRHQERKQQLENLATYRAFARRIGTIKRTTMRFLSREIKRGKVVYGYGASTKGNTLLQYYNIRKNILRAIAERNPVKWNMVTAGTNIPIVSETEARRAKPDIFVVLPWHFKDEFITRERVYLDNGGSLLFPLPTPVLVTTRAGKIHQQAL